MLLRFLYVSSLIISVLLTSCSMSARRAYVIAQQKFAQGEYEHAIEYYKMSIEKGIRSPRVDKVNFKIGECFRLSNRIIEATEFYKKSVEAGGEVDSANYYYAVGLESLGRYGEASNQFLLYSETGKNTTFMHKAKVEFDNLKLINPILEKQADFELKNMTELNTPENDWGPIVKNDILYFSTSRGQSIVHKADGQGFNDIYKFRFDGITDQTGVATPISSKINIEKTHDACPTLSEDGKTMYFARSNDGTVKGHKDVGIYVSKYKSGEWQDPEKMPFCADTSWYSTPCLSTDQKSLYFSSNKPGGLGGTDLWVSVLINDAWSEPINLGDKINTHGNEFSPYVDNKDNFYFASDGHAGLGRLDLFEVKKNASGIDIVENMGLPYNSVSDDFGLSWDNDSLGYMTSDREGGKGKDDIYQLKHILKIAHYTQNIIVYGINPKTNRERVLKNSHVTITNLKGDTIFNGKTDDAGMVSSKLDAATKYHLEAKKQKHYNYHDKVTTANPISKSKLKKGINEITFEKPIIVKLQEITLEPIRLELYYDYNKWDIRADAERVLDSLVQHMKANPTIVIELSSHTDSRGDDKYNLKLSENRAKSAVEYVIKQGINPSMISAKGEGETRPLVTPEKTEVDYQMNRRTEVRVVKILDVEE